MFIHTVMKLQDIINNHALKSTITIASIIVNTSGCYFIFGDVRPKPKIISQPSNYCIQRDMPASCRGREQSDHPVMFSGPKSDKGSCYYQTSEAQFFEVDKRGFTWNVDGSGRPEWADQYYSGHGVSTASEIYAASVRFARSQRNRRQR
jgi:hypothetical protein